MKRKNGMPKASIPAPIDIRRTAQEPKLPKPVRKQQNITRKENSDD